jgi:hypothetical protein
MQMYCPGVTGNTQMDNFLVLWCPFSTSYLIDCVFYHVGNKYAIVFYIVELWGFFMTDILSWSNKLNNDLTLLL